MERSALLKLYGNILEDENGCWVWQRAKDNGGYGFIRVSDKMVLVHRYAYELLVATIPYGLELDHICRNRACCNPAHLEPVTHQENCQRGNNFQKDKTHCKYGHEFTPENTHRYKGKRICRACKRETDKRRREDRKCQDPHTKS